MRERQLLRKWTLKVELINKDTGETRKFDRRKYLQTLVHMMNGVGIWTNLSALRRHWYIDPRKLCQFYVFLFCSFIGYKLTTFDRYVVILTDLYCLTSMSLWICQVIVALFLILVGWIHRNRWFIVSKEKFEQIRHVVMLQCWQIWVIVYCKFEVLRSSKLLHRKNLIKKTSIIGCQPKFGLQLSKPVLLLF